MSAHSHRANKHRFAACESRTINSVRKSAAALNAAGASDAVKSIIKSAVKNCAEIERARYQ